MGAAGQPAAYLDLQPIYAIVTSFERRDIELVALLVENLTEFRRGGDVICRSSDRFRRACDFRPFKRSLLAFRRASQGDRIADRSDRR